MRNILIVLSGPSGVGKGTLAKMLQARCSNIALSVSCTTRAPRKNEVDGREYFFISKEEFANKIANDGLLEYSEHFENYYGTPKEFVLDKLNFNDVLLEIDVNGGLKVKENFSDAVLVMILPPTLEDVRLRLKGRNTESDDKINLRMQRIEYELDKQKLYDYSVVNDNLEDAFNELCKIIELEKNKF